MTAMSKPETEPHAYVSIEGVNTCFACSEPQDHEIHAGHAPRPNDLIGSLGAAVKAAGLTMTLHGVPIETEDLRAAATEYVDNRIRAAFSGNRYGNGDSIPRCSNTNAEGVCMYVGPCLECSTNRARDRKLAKLRLGSVVYVRGYSKGEDRAHVVVCEPVGGRVKLAYCGSERWYLAKWYATEFVLVDVDEQNPHVKRARRWLAKVKPDHDGWKRIQTGRYGQLGAPETVGHADHVGAMVPWPADQPYRYNGSGEPCDMWTGPCSCGATHTEGK